MKRVKAELGRQGNGVEEGGIMELAETQNVLQKNRIAEKQGVLKKKDLFCKCKIKCCRKEPIREQHR